MNHQTLIACLAWLTCFSGRADQFGDIAVDANAIYTGRTFHGYAEMRVVVENHSHTKKHAVQLVYPNNSFSGYGNDIVRISRTIMLAPDAREVISLLQPPLPVHGDNSIRIDVDGGHEGEIHAPNANNHCADYSYNGKMTTVFISRSLDFNAVEVLFRVNSGAYTAAMAVGPPDAAGSGRQPNTWIPALRTGPIYVPHRGAGRPVRRVAFETNWLKLDYAAPQTVSEITIYNTQSVPSSGSVFLIGAAGTNIEVVPMRDGSSDFNGTAWETKISLPKATTVPVKSVKLDFGTDPPRSIAIDAVQISGPSGSQWASSADASSDASSEMGISGTSEGVETLRAESPVTEWSENWLAYSPFDCIFLNAADLSSMPTAVLGALGDYLAAGGVVVLSGKGDIPAAWHSWRSEKLTSGMKYEVGFGHCLALPSESFSLFDAEDLQVFRDTLRQSANYWRSLPEDTGSANHILPIIENLKIPTRGVVFIMLGFLIVIGPVNIMYLNLRKRRTWMLWTIPTISLGTTLLVFAYSFLREGFTPNLRIAGLTVIDQPSHHVATIGGIAVYCPLTPGDGLHFEFGTESTPLVQFNRGAGTPREVDWTQWQGFQRGWVSSRVPAYFHLRKSENRRERIQLVNENGKLEFINGLGSPVQHLWLADANMNYYQADHIAAGDKAGLISFQANWTPEKTGAQGLFHEVGFGASPAAITGNFAKWLLPNTYIAVLDGNPFIENALGPVSSPKRTKSSAVVFGILEPLAAK